MPIRDRRPEDEQPLIRSLQEQQLIRPTGGTQDAAPQDDDGQEEAHVTGGAEQDFPEAKGPISQAMDRAQENNWVYDSVADKARESGLLDKADGVMSRVRSALSGG